MIRLFDSVTCMCVISIVFVNSLQRLVRINQTKVRNDDDSTLFAVGVQQAQTYACFI